jgi:hypothetical protein
VATAAPDGHVTIHGTSRRDLFAAAALQGIVGRDWGELPPDYDGAAEAAWRYSQAMCFCDPLNPDTNKGKADG